MFENLRRALREAVANFKDELDRDDVPGAVDDLLRAMKREAADTRAETRRLEEAIETAISATETEKRQGETCRRREKLAFDIGDEETARVAREYAEKHEHRQEVLNQKVLVLTEELKMRRGELKEMITTIKEAEKNRDSLTATAGRATARNSIDGADDLFAELDRIAGDIQDDDLRREAQMELNETLGDDPLRTSSPEPPPLDVDARLDALKRAMGKDR